MPRDERYPNPYTHPQMRNWRQAPPGNLRTDLPVVQAGLESPKLYSDLRQVLRDNPHDPNANQMLTDLRQFRRAMNGDRALPGEYNGRTDQPTEPFPGMPREQFRPDRQPGTKAHDVMRKAVENMDAGYLADALQDRMGSDARPTPEPSLWDRMAPASERAASAPSSEPSLRESVAANFDALSSKE